MDINQLRAIGAIVPRTLFKKEIEFKYPELKPESEWEVPGIPEQTGKMIDGKMTVYIRRGCSADAVEMANATKREQAFIPIWRAVCNEKGEQIFPELEDAMQLQAWLALPLLQAINEVGGQLPKNSRPGTSSGVNSRSGSVAVRSRNGSKRSALKKRPSGTSTATNAAP